MFKIIKELPGAFTSKVELVEIDSKKFVLRTANEEEVLNEKYFQQELVKNDLPHLKLYENSELAENQLLLEYIEGSPTLSQDIVCDIQENGSNEKIIKWGRQLRKIHDIFYDDVLFLNENGFKKLSWEECVDHETSYGRLRQKQKENGLDSNIVEQVIEKINRLKEYKPKQLCLIHCDPHENNILLRGDDFVFFDKGSEFISGDPLFDTAVIALGFIGGVKGFEEFGDTCHKENLDLFIEGYGIDFREHPYFIEFLLIRCLTRYPNSFTPYLGEILKKFT